ncbi:MAG: UvrD-helicase domain-containing protein [Verrucomicrobiaceae bacterium]
MNASIRITTAGAGSGKTTELTTIMCREITSGQVRPQAIIATTFTVAAAEELGVRVRQMLHKNKLAAEARRFEESLLGTVHSVCQRLITRFAFESGLSPRVEVLDETASDALISQTIDIECSSVDVCQMERLALLLSQVDDFSKASSWKNQVKAVISRAVENGIKAEELPAMATESLKELLELLPKEATEDLDAKLLKELGKLKELIDAGADKTKSTSEALGKALHVARDLQSGHLSWAGWFQVAGLKPAKQSMTAFDEVKAVAARVEQHPRLRSDLEDYVQRIFDIASRTLARYRRRKEELGKLDFSDLEARAVELLDHPEVQEFIREEYDLLVVDEFQDTSPMQLALFMKLAQLVRVKSIWVGDLKQAIYGFRGSDPELMASVVDHLRKVGGANPPLDTSYRARPELCQWFNSLFVPAFNKSHGLQEAEVRLNPHRPEDTGLPVPVLVWKASSGQLTGDGKPKAPTNLQVSHAVAEGIQSMLASSIQVHDKASKELRPMCKRDIVVLCRSNQAADEIAKALIERGISVTRESGGLLGTPEASYAIACLKRLVDPDDTLASAIIIALGSGLPAEDWIESRLEWLADESNKDRRWLAEGESADPTILALEKARQNMHSANPSEALDEALVLGNVLSVVTRWGPGEARAAQRRANIEALRGLAVKYEDMCVTAHTPATMAGFLLWLRSLDKDFIAVDSDADGVQVHTYHGAKGLEWPVVICTELNKEPRPRIWDQVAIVQSTAFDPVQPLQGRRLRFWPWPFGRSGQDCALEHSANQSAIGQDAHHAALREELRLLYVGFTRARDQVALLARERSEPLWPQAVLESEFMNGLKNLLASPGQQQLFLGTPAQSRVIVPPDSPTRLETSAELLNWFASPLPASAKAPAFITPSGSLPVPGFRVTTEIVLGPRLPVRAGCSDVDLGNGLHAVFAAAFHSGNFDSDSLPARAQQVLNANGLAGCVNADEVIAAAGKLGDILTQELRATTVQAEVPFERVMPDGTRVNGFIDLIAHTPDGYVIVDHKTYQGSRVKCLEMALEYTGQLEHYREALLAAGCQVHSQWIHFPMVGLLVEVGRP